MEDEEDHADDRLIGDAAGGGDFVVVVLVVMVAIVGVVGVVAVGMR